MLARVEQTVDIGADGKPEGGGLAPAPDGTVWFTAQSAGKLGRLDPRTGRSDLIALGPGAAPHGVIVGPDGAAWVTEGGQNAIARVDPATRAVKLFPLPRERSNAKARISGTSTIEVSSTTRRSQSRSSASLRRKEPVLGSVSRRR
jgi:virginiamycin B lyase